MDSLRVLRKDVCIIKVEDRIRSQKRKPFSKTAVPERRKGNTRQGLTSAGEVSHHCKIDRLCICPTPTQARYLLSHQVLRVHVFLFRVMILFLIPRVKVHSPCDRSVML